MLVICLILALWPTALGGRFGVVMVAGPSMEPTYMLGDAVISWKQPAEVGDVIVFEVPKGEFGEGNPVIHRIVGSDQSGWITQGDNMEFPDGWNPNQQDLVGVAKFHIPRGGRLLAIMKSWLFVSVIGGVAVLLLFWPDKYGGKTRKGRHRG